MNQPDVVLELEPDPDDGGFWIDLVSDEGGVYEKCAFLCKNGKGCMEASGKTIKKASRGYRARP